MILHLILEVPLYSYSGTRQCWSLGSTNSDMHGGATPVILFITCSVGSVVHLISVYTIIGRKNYKHPSYHSFFQK